MESFFSVLDLCFQSHKATIASFLIKAKPPAKGDILIETGPASTLQALSDALEAAGCSLANVQHVLLTHIHLDHAGAAWALAERGARIYVHPAGLPHLADPAKLLRSATRIYGPDMDRLWGALHPIAPDALAAVADGDTLSLAGHRITAHHTPGHASHHIAWQLLDTIFCGDVAGVCIHHGPVVAPCPPPDFDPLAWQRSLQLLARLKPKRLALTHFGVIEARISEHLAAVHTDLDAVLAWMQREAPRASDAAALRTAFEHHNEARLHAAGAPSDTRAAYALANPAFMSVLGLKHYLAKSTPSATT